MIDFDINSLVQTDLSLKKIDSQTIQVLFPNCPGDLFIELSSKDNKYIARLNYSYWEPWAHGPYQFTEDSSTAKDAVIKLLRGIRTLPNRNHPPESVFWGFTNSEGEKQYFDGNGQLFSAGEVKAIRKNLD